MDGNIICSDDEKVNLLNEYFESVFTFDDGCTPTYLSRLPADTPAKENIKIQPEIITKILRKLKTNSSAGPDSEWGLSYITPILKKGSPSDPKNYRPIALTCTACKFSNHSSHPKF